MTGRDIVRIRAFERRFTRVAVGAGGLLLIVTIVPVCACWWVG